MRYPQGGTAAELALKYIRDNPGCSQNAIMLGIDRNISVTTNALRKLHLHKLIRVEVDTDSGHKSHYCIQAAG